MKYAYCNDCLHYSPNEACVYYSMNPSDVFYMFPNYEVERGCPGVVWDMTHFAYDIPTPFAPCSYQTPINPQKPAVNRMQKRRQLHGKH